MVSDNLDRFLRAQATTYDEALKEVCEGRKRSHWMWFVFPQLKALGFSETAQYYGISGLKEASEYLEHPVLGKRLIAITTALLDLGQTTATSIFGHPDDLKLHSSMTLFAQVPGANAVFVKVLEQYFDGLPDDKTLALLNNQHNALI